MQLDRKDGFLALDYLYGSFIFIFSGIESDKDGFDIFGEMSKDICSFIFFYIDSDMPLTSFFYGITFGSSLKVDEC